MSTGKNEFKQWIGRTETACDDLIIAPILAMAAMLDKNNMVYGKGDQLPPLWHWLFFLNPARQSTLARDGHPERGGFLPPIPLPRRMWAGSRFDFHQPLCIGEKVSRQSTIKSITFKEGRSGNLAFVCVCHEISGERGLSISEEHDIVYRCHIPADSPPPLPNPAPTNCDFSKKVDPDPVLLFRYSALTFNGHRIHYDRDYVTQEEGYPGLIVHGPLLATLMTELFGDQYPDKQLTKFEFTAMNPVFDLDPFQVCGLDANKDNVTKLWVKDHAGSLCMKGSATISQQ